ncbi:IclR family transcriptional regulator [Streptomyces sp. NPDC093510]|uniref:IclR family transcriptional regulator n=1 Tax=Streptomyces sp. NPDC093510 TaxID=3155199 RepID=UPI003437140D
MQELARALQLLGAVVETECGTSLSELAARTGIPVSSTSRTLDALCEEGLIARSQHNRRYHVGSAALALAPDAVRRPFAVGYDEAMRLAQECGERVIVSELFGNQVVCTAVTEPRTWCGINLFARVGQPMPMHASAAARILLAYQPGAEVMDWLSQRPLTRFTARTPQTLEDVQRLLDVARAREFAISYAELQDGVWAVAAPIRSSTGQVCSGLTIAARAERVEEAEQRSRLIGLVNEAALRVSRGLGYVA